MERLLLLSVIFLTACGLSQEEKENIAAVTCSIMSETRNMDAAVRVREMNDAREKIGGEPFLRGDSAIQEAFAWGLCQELVLNESYDETLQSLKDANRERERIAAAKLAEKVRIAAKNRRIAAEKLAEEKRIAAEKLLEEQRIADSKPTVEEAFHSNGKLKTRINYQSKSDGGKRHGLSEWFHDNGQLFSKRNYKDGKLEDGLYEYYHANGQLESKIDSKDGVVEGLYESYHSDGQLQTKVCYKNGERTDMSYCDNPTKP